MFRCVRALLAALTVILPVLGLQAQTDNATIRTRIKEHFQEYQADLDLKSLKVDRTNINRNGRRLDIYLNQNFSYQRFRHSLIDTIYKNLRSDLPQDIRRYSIGIHTADRTIEQLIPNWARKVTNRDDLWNETEYKGLPWVSNDSRPYTPTKGLTNIHMAVTPSHGLYYDNGDSLWEWQRPPLYCTREDLICLPVSYPDAGECRSCGLFRP